jgi:hypothetical protein
MRFYGTKTLPDGSITDGSLDLSLGAQDGRLLETCSPYRQYEIESMHTVMPVKPGRSESCRMK